MTDDDKALAKRLRRIGSPTLNHSSLLDAITAHKIADRIEALSAENERLREALERIGDELSTCGPDDCENGVRSLNERAASLYLKEYPHTAAAIKFAIHTIRAALGDTK